MREEHERDDGGPPRLAARTLDYRSRILGAPAAPPDAGSGVNCAVVAHGSSTIRIGGKLRVALMAGLGVIAFGTIAFEAVGGGEWTIFDALYMSVITATTVGYGEVHRLDGAGRMVAMFVSLGGVGTLFYALTAVAQVVLEGDVLRRRRLTQKIEHTRDHFVVCGFGRVGRAICRELNEQRVPFVVISLDDPGTDAPALWLQGDATDDDTLRRAGILRARALVAVLGADADNIYTVLAARSLRPDLFIVARCSETRSSKKLEAAGANRVINPYERGGSIMAQGLMRPRVVDFLEETGRGSGLSVSFEEIHVHERSSLVGQELRESPIRRDLDVIVAAIRKADGRSLFNPSSTQRIDAGDILIVMGSASGLDRLGVLARAPVNPRAEVRS